MCYLQHAIQARKIFINVNTKVNSKRSDAIALTCKKDKSKRSRCDADVPQGLKNHLSGLSPITCPILRFASTIEQLCHQVIHLCMIETSEEKDKSHSDIGRDLLAWQQYLHGDSLPLLCALLPP